MRLRLVVIHHYLSYRVIHGLPRASITDGSIFSVTTLWQKLHIHNYDILYFLFEEPLKHLIKMEECCGKSPTERRHYYVLSRIFKLSFKFVSEIVGTLVLTATVFGMFYTGFMNEGVMRIVGPLAVLICGIGAYVLVMYPTTKISENDKKGQLG